LRTDLQIIISSPEFLSRRSSAIFHFACISVRISIYKYPFFIYLFIYSRRAMRPAKPRGLGVRLVLAFSGGTPADPGGSVSEFEKICGIISSTKGLIISSFIRRSRLALPRTDLGLLRGLSLAIL